METNFSHNIWVSGLICVRHIFRFTCIEIWWTLPQSLHWQHTLIDFMTEIYSCSTREYRNKWHLYQSIRGFAVTFLFSFFCFHRLSASCVCVCFLSLDFWGYSVTRCQRSAIAICLYGNTCVCETVCYAKHSESAFLYWIRFGFWMLMCVQYKLIFQ